ncbi:isoaspartyl peptidase/L-asparaginase family protein [Rahnella sp. Larv3_ips]|uniref:isoaspartyl peptidase/L-asparaginase family protein n=1 Tax=Rahnella sp. Larv3_ips TaxID=1896943 RepID=UPI000EFAC248|nr:isoaspartyl peptidase/L-asparaginase [Rahnella sp. Larv3_ips]
MSSSTDNSAASVSNTLCPVIAIHGGAGAITRAAMSAEKEQLYLAELERIVASGQAILASGGSALDAVTEAVRLLEECPLFNAGKGAVFTHQGTHELDACIMDGRTLDAGAISCVNHIRNPILTARKVLEVSPHVMFTGAGAEAFAREQGQEMVGPDYFFTQERYDQLQRAIAADSGVILDHDGASQSATPSGDPLDPEHKFGTVGAVAMDALGNLAAATSTGGMTNKQAGRVGDSPIIGAGCYASNKTVAISSTGTGEVFMRTVAAYDVAALIEYAGLSLEEATHRVVQEKLLPLGGIGGMIAIDRFGNVVLPFNSEGMYRGFARVGDVPSVSIYRS